jgi:DNA repair protein RecN (Recombination protein N)
MLCELHIKNLAIIKDISLNFDDGFSILTGETGAGKSIILQSLNLLSGAKGNATVVRSGTKQAVIEAVFELATTTDIPAILEEGGFDKEDELIIKRTIGANGRSRFYVNGGLANAKTARKIAAHLISIASQHDHQQLLNPRNHLDFVDTIGDTVSDRSQYQEIYSKWQRLKKQYTELSDATRDKEQHREFLAYQIKEINDAVLQPDEDIQLNEEKSILRGSTENQQLSAKSLDLLFVANQNLGRVRVNLEQIATIDQNASSISEAIAEQSYLLEEHFGELRRYAENIPHDPARLEEIGERIGIIASLKRKYGVTILDILDFASQIQEELTAIKNGGETLSTLQSEIDVLHEDLIKKAGKLSKKRKITCAKLETEMNAELASLCLKNGHFTIANKDIPPSAHGCDDLEFLFSANHGEQIKPLKDVASGGELSRLLLGLKCILAQQDHVKTIIFDEIDSGISGEAAESVALKIKQLASHHQVICISHLVQIASLAHDHFRVSKEIIGDRTNTTITLLDKQQTIESLAQMLDGTSVSDSTRKYVQKLVARKDL